jgi:hypothetical protein
LSSNGEKQAIGMAYRARTKPMRGFTIPSSRTRAKLMAVKLAFIRMKDIEQKRIRDGRKAHRNPGDNTRPI